MGGDKLKGSFYYYMFSQLFSKWLRWQRLLLPMKCASSLSELLHKERSTVEILQRHACMCSSFYTRVYLRVGAIHLQINTEESIIHSNDPWLTLLRVHLSCYVFTIASSQNLILSPDVKSSVPKKSECLLMKMRWLHWYLAAKSDYVGGKNKTERPRVCVCGGGDNEINIFLLLLQSHTSDT